MFLGPSIYVYNSVNTTVSGFFLAKSRSPLERPSRVVPSARQKRPSPLPVRMAIARGTKGLYREMPDNTTRKRVVVTGMGIVSCFGSDVETFYQKLLAGESGVRVIDKFDCASWDTHIAAWISPDQIQTDGYIAPKLARRLDSVLKYTLIAGKRALEHAGIGIGTEAFQALRKDRVGAVVGSGMGGLETLAEGCEKLSTGGVRRMSPFFIPYSITNMGSSLLAMEGDLHGPNYSVSTACATSNYAIHNSYLHIIQGDADVMLCGGSEAAVIPIGLGGFIACRALSKRNDEPTRASRPWDKHRDGFVMGEGSGILVLESLEHAKARGAPILCEYLGGAYTNDAYSVTEPIPEGTEVARCIQFALTDANVEPSQVNYINAHATSTPLGDMAEYRALSTVFDAKKITMNATKSLIGHALGAAGGLEAVATIMGIRTGELHPTINAEETEPEIEADIVPNIKKKMQVEVGISSSFGFGGHNSVCVFAPYIE
ncbi:3-oxoacyl- acyl-carrier-protein -synthase [Cyanidiococcus yangmingshanensis]|uniref:3-oxoacyl-[acyl-carrier-protein] synthase I, chloroplastic n=1 Tax=Cyanidiococcus yangmingshanensis TaxID=2690220 RepID=A0A7J7IKB3_9RHOD|nr:3-oxoacyl- acyl-carrier-protein -synthase [Cyanidiococcus yangmingshanensis]